MIDLWIIIVMAIAFIVLIALTFASGLSSGKRIGWHEAINYYKEICRNCPYKLDEKKPAPYLRRIK